MRILLCAVVVFMNWDGNLVRADEALRTDALAALHRAVNFATTKVAAHGGYVYRYSADLSKREGEGKTGLDVVWVQPPGTPSVGLAFVEAYERTGDQALLDAARAAADCLIRGQLRSGAWNASIDFSAEGRAKNAYRIDPPRKKLGFNWSTFDDEKSQSAMRFLMRLDQALDFRDTRIHEAITFALDSVLAAQFPNGAWPQGYEKPASQDLANFPIKPASYADDWLRKHPGEDYWVYYTFNDNAMADVIDMLLLASRIYREPKFRAAALRGGEFILLAQMPEPQPAWAQQYDFAMHPIWARKFEPPAVSGLESQGLMRTLLRLYVETGDGKFLAPIPRSIAYLRRSQLPDGRLARFYELRTNKPLYFTQQYELTHDDTDLPTHYGFQVGNGIAEIEREAESLARATPAELAKRREPSRKPEPASASLEKQVKAVIAALDDRGAWVTDGKLRYHGKGDDTTRVIETTTLIRNLTILSRYCAANQTIRSSSGKK